LTPCKALRYDCQFDLSAQWFLGCGGGLEPVKGRHGQGKTNVSAEQEAARAGARVSGSHEHEKRASGTQTPSGEGPETSQRQQRIASVAGSARFRPDERIRRRADFQQVYQKGVRVNGRFSTTFFLPNHQETGRLGIAATKKLGGAVQRNRAKRLIREVFRRNKIAPGFDVVIVPHRGLLETSLTTLEADYRTTLERRLRQRR
jgi:ribonuclease P protein component